MTTWATTDPELDLPGRFGESMVNRAKKRVVRANGSGWTVDGDGALGDAYESYYVTFDGRKYHCSCRLHAHGEYRKFCSHALAALMERKREKREGNTNHQPVQTLTGDRGVESGFRAPTDDGFSPAQSSSPVSREGLGESVASPLSFTDPQALEWGEPRLPGWVTEFRGHQTDAVEEIVARFKSGDELVMVDAPTGCLAGDTLIQVNRGGASRKYPIRDLVHRFNGGTFRKGRNHGVESKWDPNIPTMIQRCSIAPKYGFAGRLVPLVRAVVSGVKPTYTLRTTTGRVIRATRDHRFLLDGGAMIPLSDLRPGDELVVDVGKSKKAIKSSKPWYRVAQGLTNHPHRGEWPYRQPIHRLVVEAEMNHLPTDWYIAILRDKNASVNDFQFLSPTQAVHHINHDTQDNSLSNLEVVSHVEHSRNHGLEGQWANVANRFRPEIVESITYHGEEETFDLTVLDDPHNYVANGFVVENSGKTLIAEMVRRRLGTRAIYVCSTISLQSQFMADFGYAKELKGRNNYPTVDRADAFGSGSFSVTAADCTKELMDVPACVACPEKILGERLHCMNCHPVSACPYEVAKKEALAADIAVLNTAYFLTECNGPGKFSGSELVIVDEADLLENELMGHVEVRIGPRLQKELKLQPPAKKTVESAWVEWLADEAMPKVRGAMRRIPAKTHDVAKRRKRQQLERLLDRMRGLEQGLGDGGWVYDGNQGEIVFRPVRVDGIAGDVLWRHGRRWLLLTATLISADECVESLGVAA